MHEKDGDNGKRGNSYLSLRFRSIHLSSFNLSEEDPDNPSLSAEFSPRFILLNTSYLFSKFSIQVTGDTLGTLAYPRV